MLVDLLMLIVIGCILEFLCTRYGALVLNATPFTYISLLITFVAVVRWKLWGLLVIPFLQLANMYAGQNIELSYLASVYDWRFYISSIVGFATMGLNVLFFKKDTGKIIQTTPVMVLLMIFDYILINVVQLAVYRLLTSGSVLEMGTIIVSHPTIEAGVNKCRYGESGFIYNLFGLCIMVVGCLVLRSQGIVCDRKQRFIDDKLNAELDRIDAMTFTIQEADEEEEKTSNSNLG